MPNTDYIAVGKLRKPHGIHGAFGFLLDRELKKKTTFPLHFFLERANQFLPFFIEKTELTAFDGGYLKFEEINSPEEAKKWATSDLYLTAADVKKYFKEAKNDFDFLIGFTVFDREQSIGQIAQIEEMPGQLMMTVNREEQEIYLPLVEDWIIAVEKKKKRLQLELPAGILDL